jgi:hypothetical protein
MTMPQRLPALVLLLVLLAGCGSIATTSGALRPAVGTATVAPTPSAVTAPGASARPTVGGGGVAVPSRTVTGGSLPNVPPGLAATATAVAALPTASAAPAAPAAKLGERVVVGGAAITLNAKQDNAPSDALPPPAGSRRYIVSLTIENTGTAPLLYSALFATIVLTDDSVVNVTFDTYPTPLLAGGALDPGEDTRGWLTFDLPTGAIPARLVYDDPDGVATFTLK